MLTAETSCARAIPKSLKPKLKGQLSHCVRRLGAPVAGKVMHAWVAEMSAYIKQLDSSHLVAIGDEGWRCDLQGSHGSPFQWMNNGTKARPTAINQSRAGRAPKQARQPHCAIVTTAAPLRWH